MMDVGTTIAPKSDQLNSDDLISGPRTVTITRVAGNEGSAEQPINIFFEGDNGKPYRPCKSMRRVLVSVWGRDGNEYVGRAMTLYRDPSVRFGGLEVGGTRISHMSHIEKPITMALTATRANRKPYTVQPLKAAPKPKPEQRHDPETGDVGAPDAPFDWETWTKGMAAKIDASETLEDLAILQSDNAGKLADLGNIKRKWADALNMKFGDRMRAIGSEEE